jgi:hypothetical protein
LRTLASAAGRLASLVVTIPSIRPDESSGVAGHRKLKAHLALPRRTTQ